MRGTQHKRCLSAFVHTGGTFVILLSPPHRSAVGSYPTSLASPVKPTPNAPSSNLPSSKPPPFFSMPLEQAPAVLLEACVEPPSLEQRARFAQIQVRLQPRPNATRDQTQRAATEHIASILRAATSHFSTFSLLAPALSTTSLLTTLHTSSAVQSENTLERSRGEHTGHTTAEKSRA